MGAYFVRVMKQEIAYPYRKNADRTVFEFVSVGPKGRVVKLIEFTALVAGADPTEDVYNLALGDRGADGLLDDQPVTNNGDTQPVLLTVAAAVVEFTQRHPQARLLATGGTPARTRLYQMGIARNLPEIQADFVIEGLTAAGWEDFQVGIPYHAFLIRRRFTQ